jgi:hypothetical protein
MSTKTIPSKPADVLASLTASQVTLVRAIAASGNKPLDAKGLVAIGAITSTANVTSYIGSPSRIPPSKATIMAGYNLVHEYWDALKLAGSVKSAHYSLLGLGLITYRKETISGSKRKVFVFQLSTRGKKVADLIAKRES